eukprot:2728371-Pleurochrysis_carterae.AAC.1
MAVHILLESGRVPSRVHQHPAASYAAERRDLPQQALPNTYPTVVISPSYKTKQSFHIVSHSNSCYGTVTNGHMTKHATTSILIGDSTANSYRRADCSSPTRVDPRMRQCDAGMNAAYHQYLCGYSPWYCIHQSLLTILLTCHPHVLTNGMRQRDADRSPLCTDKARSLKEPRTLRAEHELRQLLGTRQRNGEFGADCLGGEAAVSNVAENVAIGSQDGQ